MPERRRLLYEGDRGWGGGGGGRGQQQPQRVGVRTCTYDVAWAFVLCAAYNTVWKAFPPSNPISTHAAVGGTLSEPSWPAGPASPTARHPPYTAVFLGWELGVGGVTEKTC